MKRINNLYQKIISIENLQLADIKARKGRRKSYGIKLHDRNREKNIIDLHIQLKNKKFKTSKYHIFKIYKPKERTVYQLPYYPDRIVHHAVMNLMEPIWVKTFTSDSYSCIKHRGIHGILRNLKKALRDEENTQYCLKIDAKKFFPNINHDILKKIIRKKIKDKDLLNLLDEIIDSAPGVPIGNYLSQYFANLYLTYFDHYVKEVLKVKYYFRYTDDMVFLHKNKKELHSLLKDITLYSEKELNLKIKDNWQVFPVEDRGLDFVGYVFRHDYTLMRKTIKKRMCRKISKLRKSNTDNQILMQKISSWTGWAKHCNSKNLLKKLKIKL